MLMLYIHLRYRERLSVSISYISLCLSKIVVDAGARCPVLRHCLRQLHSIDRPHDMEPLGRVQLRHRSVRQSRCERDSSRLHWRKRFCSDCVCNSRTFWNWQTDGCWHILVNGADADGHYHQLYAILHSAIG